jgi:hypothetical protein
MYYIFHILTDTWYNAEMDIFLYNIAVFSNDKNTANMINIRKVEELTTNSIKNQYIYINNQGCFEVSCENEFEIIEIK